MLFDDGRCASDKYIIFANTKNERMKKVLFFLMLIAAAGCTSDSGTKTLSTDVGGSLTDLNQVASGSLFDSIRKADLPFTDTLTRDEALPVFSMPVSVAQLNFLKLSTLRLFSDNTRPLKPADIHIVARLPLSPDFYSIIFHYRGEGESMNYLITYDRNFQVVDYLMTAFAEDMDAAPRLRSIIDSTGLAVSMFNPADNKEIPQTYTYTISGDGFFREMSPPIASK